MKIFIFIIFIQINCFALELKGVSVKGITTSGTTLLRTNYYVSNDGDNNADGLTEETPWQTLSKLSTVFPGTVINLDGSSTFREVLPVVGGRDLNYPTIYQSYGIGKAKILGSLDKSLVSDWTETSTNIWNCGNFYHDIGNIIFNNEASFGVKKQDEDELLQQGDFWYDVEHFPGYNHIKLYSVGYPATVYSHIELAQYVYTIEAKPYTVFNGLDVRYCGAIAFSGSSNSILRNCDFSFIGGCDQDETYGVRFGNAVQFWGEISNCLVENCTVTNSYDAAMCYESLTATTVDGLVFQNNTISKNEYSFEFWNHSDDGTQKNITFTNNICSDAGESWGHNQRWNESTGCHIRFGTSPGMVDNVSITHNIFSGATESNIRFAKTSDISKLIFDYNSYGADDMMCVEETNTIYETLLEWQTVSGQDLNSVVIN
ncbi:MAG: hypothetical protein WC364_14035 [Eubacteriales bacterium]|jgi:hypothetical protein